MFYQTTCVKVYDGYITIRVYLVWYIIIVTLIIYTIIKLFFMMIKNTIARIEMIIEII